MRRNVKTSSQNRLLAYRSGLWAEALCRFVLRTKGYRIVATRHRSWQGETDIIAVRRRSLVFVEVKARKTELEAAEAIKSRQRERMERCAAEFVSRNPRYAGYNIRFDAMLVTPWKWPVHITNAWEAQGQIR